MRQDILGNDDAMENRLSHNAKTTDFSKLATVSNPKISENFEFLYK